MKKLAILALAIGAANAQALVFPTAFFAAPANMQESFDSMVAGPYNAFPVFGVPAVCQRSGTGTLMVGPHSPPVSAPNILVGRSADIRITTLTPMRRFGGYFNSGYFGAMSTTATFRFYDASNNFIGQQVVPLTTTMTWRGFITLPKWRRVEIFGNVPGIQGLVGMDSLRIRPN